MSKYLKLAIKYIDYNKMTIKNYQKTKRHLILFVICIFTILVISQPIQAKSDQSMTERFERKRVLFLSAYDSSFPTFFNQLNGIQAVLNEEQYQLDIEFMDSKRFYTEENLENIKERMYYKLDILEPYDLVIAGDDNALQFVMDNKDKLFLDIPIVYLGINDLNRAQEADKMGDITGVVEVTSTRETLDLALGLDEDIMRLAIIVDNTASGQGELKNIISLQPYYPKIVFEVYDLSNLTYKDLSKEIAEFGEDTIILLISAYNDSQQNKMTFYEYLKFIRSYTSTPIFHLYDFGIGSGALGGVVVDYFQQGYKAAQLGIQVLEGKNPEEISSIKDKSVNNTIIDYRLFNQYGYDLKRLPIETIYLNKPINFFEKNKVIILVSSAVVWVLGVIILLLSINIKRRKIIEKSLQGSNEELSALYEQMIALNQELESSEEELKESYKNLNIKNNLLEESEERYKYVFELSSSGLWEKSMKTDQIYITKDWYSQLLKKDLINIDDINPLEILNGFYHHLKTDTYNELLELREKLVNGEIASYSKLLECCKNTKESHFIEEKAKAIYDEDGSVSKVIGSHTNVTSSILYKQQLEEFAYKDQLTQMPNRLILEQQLQNMEQNPDVEIVTGSIILVDVDNFKFINNTYGHEIGDELLKNIAYRISELLKESSLENDYIIGRISGDEFVIICNGLSEKADIDIFADKIVNLFTKRFRLRERSIYITVSLGISIYPENGTDLDTLLNRCNSAVQEAKIKGKNRYEIYDTTLNETMENKIYIQNNIREAIENNRFKLYYQPIYDVVENRIKGFEALIRWKDDVRGFIPPMEFITVAEKIGVINRLGEWVLKEAATFAKYLLNVCDEDIYVSVNVSSVQLIQKDFVDLVLDVVSDVGIKHKNLCLEITETALMHSLDFNIEKLVVLRKNGIKISLDDFGTGYSSLNYLRRLPIDVLKIDKSFIDELTSSPEGRELTEGIILLAQKIGIYLIAEGVEQKLQLKYLIDYNCDGIQGYLISRPLPSGDVKEFYEGFIGLNK